MRSSVIAGGPPPWRADKLLVCTHATFQFAVAKFRIEKFDDRLVGVDDLHHVSADDMKELGRHLGQLIARQKAHIVAMAVHIFVAMRRLF